MPPRRVWSFDRHGGSFQTAPVIRVRPSPFLRSFFSGAGRCSARAIKAVLKNCRRTSVESGWNTRSSEITTNDYPKHARPATNRRVASCRISGPKEWARRSGGPALDDGIRTPAQSSISPCAVTVPGVSHAPPRLTASSGVRCTFLSQIQHVAVTQEQIGL